MNLNEKSPTAQWVDSTVQADGLDPTSIRSVGDILKLAKNTQKSNINQRLNKLLSRIDALRSEDGKYRGVVRLTYEDKEKKWLLTAFEKGVYVTGKSSDTASFSNVGDTALYIDNNASDRIINQRLRDYQLKIRIDRLYSRIYGGINEFTPDCQPTYHHGKPQYSGNTKTKHRI
ncbi:hypothetical protein Q7352_08100 [Glaesserella parasuis]|uniref:hypothetical protein n=2 Tax=Glaesserella parasuis TaxID=738 RepID=UPI0024370948|nr:hypothetical protein [Glaesserella parasuis]MDG6828550.1 hypothetical protein [Glaesserella parasuis]MDO9931228.1 hypothetical protein [Glaesserella parasuis]MDO9982346.1 hypothetical protein [Glaesserella parasuis]MDP0020443.1 hypothetical protein [Glaesserella parasuis]MDP0128850.1 hypothetical protein [Glaesserella parasuis]